MITHVILSMGPEGDLYLNEGNDVENNLLVHVHKSVIVLLELFDETRQNFSYEGDSERAATMLRWMLEDKGYEICEPNKFLRRVITLCSPGPGYTDDPDYWTFRVRPL